MPVNVKNRYGLQGNLKPIVRKDTISNVVNSVAQRTYAVILSGGYNANSNYQRYWNDCSFIYQTLVNKYEVPKENIYPIMSDGDDPAVDLRTVYGYSMSQPLDLDRDGEKDIYLSATKSNISQTLNSLASKLKKDDHLLFYVIDHGGSDDKDMKSFIWLWDEQKLYDTELAQMLTPFTKKLVNVNVVLGQCYSGGFIDDLTKIGCVVATACKGSEPSWSCSDKPYDEFVYHWTCAVNEATHSGTEVLSDADSNGNVTMEEAFEYAMLNDRRTEEHPQYKSTPISVGEDLAFNHLSPSIDLYIQDNPEDTGKEPNLTTDKFWLSPSVWIRNKADGIYEHENPIYSEDHVAVTIYVRVHNRGKVRYEGNKHYVHLYWAKASTGFTVDAWSGNETNDKGEITGGPILPASVITSIDAGGYTDIKTTWALPADIIGTVEDNWTEKHHFCILAQITDSQKETCYSGDFSYDILGSNNDAQINVSIISLEELNDVTDVYVRNVSDTEHKYTLELLPRTNIDEQIYSAANIEMELSPKVYQAWGNGGYNGTDIKQDQSINPRIVQFVSKESKLEGLALGGKQFDVVKLKFNFRRIPMSTKKYTLDMIQRDESGKIIGGETFIVESPIPNRKTLEVHPVSTSGDGVVLTTNSEEDASIRWESESGFTISNQKRIKVRKSSSSRPYHVYALTADGELSDASVDIEDVPSAYNIYFDNDELIIESSETILNNLSVKVASIATGEIEAVYSVECDDSICRINVSNLPQGMHTATLISGSDVVTTYKFVK